MSYSELLVRKIILIILVIFSVSGFAAKRKTVVSIKDNQFYINGELTYKGRYWQGNKIEGLLFNSRMVQGIFDELNPDNKDKYAYPDTKKWDPERNTREFIAHMEEWRSYGLLAIGLNLQGGSPIGYENYANLKLINSAFDVKGNFRMPYIKRLEKILDKADKLGMVVILGYFYQGQEHLLENEEAVIRAVDNMTNWILDKGYKNVMIEINNECDVMMDHKILKPDRVHELISRAKNRERKGYRLLVSTSYGGRTIPKPNVVKEADFILLHGNGVSEPSEIKAMVEATKKVDGYRNQPILFNEDDHFNFESETNNFLTAIRSYASWGYFDYRFKGEGFEEGFQGVPTDWGINSSRKKGFFNKLKEITGY